MNELLIGGLLSPVIVLAVTLGICFAIWDEPREKRQKVYNVIGPVFVVSAIVSIICLVLV